MGARHLGPPNFTVAPMMNESTELVLVIDVPGMAPAGKTIGPVVEFWKPCEYATDNDNAFVT